MSEQRNEGEACEHCGRTTPHSKRECAKCGSGDLHIQFKRAGDYEGGVWSGGKHENVWEPHTGRTDPRHPWGQFWLADSLAITCRTCRYRWVEKPRDALTAVKLDNDEHGVIVGSQTDD